MSESLKMKYGSSANVEFLGMIHGDAVGELLAGARFSVLPSEWYENNPMGVIESLCAGTPVLGAAIGGIPELIDDGKTGFLFEAGNTEKMTEAMRPSRKNGNRQPWEVGGWGDLQNAPET